MNRQEKSNLVGLNNRVFRTSRIFGENMGNFAEVLNFAVVAYEITKFKNGTV